MVLGVGWVVASVEKQLLDFYLSRGQTGTWPENKKQKHGRLKADADARAGGNVWQLSGGLWDDKAVSPQ